MLIVEFSCGASTSENGTYFENPNGSQERICNFMLNRANSDICQVQNIMRIETYDYMVNDPFTDSFRAGAV